VEGIIAERTKNGPFVSIFDMIKRINQRTANKKTLESLAYAGAFDCFPELHRAQYFFMPPGDTSTGLEKLIKFGNVYQTNSTNNSNSLFGDMAMPDVATPKIPSCNGWSLTELLEHEKDVIGIFMSGHPLDHFKFEITHYGITRLGEFNEIKEAVTLQANPGKQYRLAGLVVDAQHRVSRAGKQFGSCIIEDYTGKTEFMLWSEDYARYSNYLEKGKNLFLTGSFRQRYEKAEFEFKIEKIMLLESIKQALTRQVVVDMEARHVREGLVQFLENNFSKYPGKSSLKVNIIEPKQNYRICLYSPGAGFEMNDEMTAFLENTPELEVNIVTI
jgi:DNA polymerase III subunit alpha